MDEIVAVTITAEDVDWLAEFTGRLVADRLAACGNITPNVRSIYRWEGDVQDDPEARVVLHSRLSLVGEIVQRADTEHPYDVPQVVATPIVAANPAYHRWVIEETRGPRATAP